MTKAELAETYRGILFEEGYSPRIDDDGDVVFKFEGRTHFIIINPDDPMFFNLVLPNFWPIESGEERMRVIQAAAEATSEMKVAKVYPRKENTWAGVEMFCSPPESVQPVLRRALEALRSTVDYFVRVMEAETEEPPDRGLIN